MHAHTHTYIHTYSVHAHRHKPGARSTDVQTDKQTDRQTETDGGDRRTHQPTASAWVIKPIKFTGPALQFGGPSWNQHHCLF